MPTALAEAEGYLRFLEHECDATEYAEKWWNGLIDAFLSLQKMPRRCPTFRSKTTLKKKYATSSTNLTALFSP
jgi:hypothetical protein